MWLTLSPTRCSNMGVDNETCKENKFWGAPGNDELIDCDYSTGMRALLWKLHKAENRVKQLEDGMEELASIMREELAELRRKIGNR